MEIKQRLDNLKESNRVSELKSVNTSQDLSDQIDNDSNDDKGGLPSSTFFLLPPPPFDPNLLLNVPNSVLKINEPKLETGEAIFTIENLLKGENENKKIVMCNKLNALFLKATNI